MTTENETGWQDTTGKWFDRIVTAIVFLVICGVWTLWSVWANANDLSRLAPFGDSFGTINTLFSGLAFGGLIVTLLMQRRELQLQRRELRDTREVFVQQGSLLKKQTDVLLAAPYRERDRLALDLMREYFGQHGLKLRHAAWEAIQPENRGETIQQLLTQSEDFPHTRDGFTHLIEAKGHQLESLFNMWLQWIYACDNELANRNLIRAQFAPHWEIWRGHCRMFIDDFMASADRRDRDYDWFGLVGRMDEFLNPNTEEPLS